MAADTAGLWNEGSATARLCVRDFLISGFCHDFRISFDFCLLLISRLISRDFFGFLGISLDF